MKKLLLLLLTPICLSAQDFTHLNLAVQFDTLNQSVSGSVQHRIVGLKADDTLHLNAIKMEFSRVLLNGKPIVHFKNDTALFVIPAKENLRANAADTLRIEYTCQPRKGIYFIGWDDSSFSAPRQIWTQGQGIDHRHWIPHRDTQTDKVIVEIKATFNAQYSVVSNGVLKNVQRQGTKKNWHYAMQEPMSSYLIALMIARYDSVQTKSDQGLPLSQYFYPHRAADYPWYYRHNEEIFNFMQAEIQVPYPWQNYKQAPVQDFRHGAMENTGATLFGDFFLVDSIAFNDRNYTYVNAHELAHQWFGNSVTATGSKHHWLHEGFATYYQWLSEQNLYGQDFYDYERYKAQQQIEAASLADSLPLAHPKAGSARFYQKGAWVLHMLVQEIGRDTFRQAMVNYLNAYQKGVVTTDSLQMVLEKTCACNLNPFFQQWVYTPYEPALTLQERVADKALQVKVNYTTGFALPLHFVVHAKNGSSDTLRFETNPQQSSAQFTLAQKADEVITWQLLNAGDLLAYLKVFKPQGRWFAQYAHSTSLLNKLRVVEAMQTYPDKESVLFLEDVLENANSHFLVRYRALEILLTKSKKQSQKQDYLLQALRSDDVQLQKRAVRAVDETNTKLHNRLVYLRRYGQSYQLRAAALALTVDFSSQAANRWLYDSLWQQQPGLPDNEVHLTALLYRILIFQDKGAFDQISLYSSNRYGFLTRLRAMELITALKIADEITVARLFDGLFNSNWKLRKAARQALQELNKGQNSALIAAYRAENEAGWTEQQQRIVSSSLD